MMDRVEGPRPVCENAAVWIDTRTWARSHGCARAREQQTPPSPSHASVDPAALDQFRRPQTRQMPASCDEGPAAECGHSSRDRAREARGAGARDRGALSVAAGRQRRAAGASRADAALLRARHGRARRFDVVHAPRRLCVQGEGGSESGGGWSEQRRSQSAYQLGRRAWLWSLAPAFCAVPRPSQDRGRGSGCGRRSGGRPGSGARRLAQSLPA